MVNINFNFETFAYGAFIYDVHTEGGGGLPSKADIVSNRSKGGCVNLWTRGRGGKKIRNFCGRPKCKTLFCMADL